MNVTHNMKWTRTIMVIEDDMDDQELLKETFLDLNYPNPVIFFSNGDDALNYLCQTSSPPVLIISDINMPKMNGFEIRETIDASTELRKLDIPFVFLTTQSQKDAVANTYPLIDHGFFTKPYGMQDLRNTIKSIVEYWLYHDTSSINMGQPKEQADFPIREASLVDKKYNEIIMGAGGQKSERQSEGLA